MQRAQSPEFPSLHDNAYRVRAQVDVLMPGGMTSKKQYYIFDKEQLKTLGKPDGLTRAELQRGAINVLRFALTRLER
jgi:beta-glucosidase